VESLAENSDHQTAGPIFRLKERCAPSDFRVLLVYPNLPLMLVPPLSMAIFTQLMKQQGYGVSLFETTPYLGMKSVSPENRVKYAQARMFDYERDLGVTIKTTDMFEDFRAKVLEYDPHILIYSVVEDAFVQCLGLMRAIADLDIPHVVGGVFPTAAPERALSEDGVKVIGVGEGEDIIVRMCEAVRQHEPFDKIPGIWIKRSDGSVAKNSRGELININGQRPDFTLFDDRRFYRPMGGRIFKTMPIETYRGCPYQCTYCNSPMHVDHAREEKRGNFLRRKPISMVRDEIASVVDRFNPEFLYFVDDSFLARPKKEIFDFCDMYEEFKLPFWFNTRPENCRLPEMKRLKEVGAYRISFGIECGNEEFRRKILLRSVSNKQLVDSFAVIAESGIPFSVNLIIGFPGETRDLVMDTVELVRSIEGYDTLTVSIFTPYHGTRLRTVAVRNNWLDGHVLTEHTTSSSLLRMPPPYLSSTEIDGLMRVLPLYCYFPKSEWDEIERAEIADEAGNAIYAKYMDVYKTEFLGEDQAQKQRRYIEGGSGCKSNPKDAYHFSPSRMSDVELMTLTP
jgi:radical SAM superfamily enzyme YgiQ (UPF0313 family)